MTGPVNMPSLGYYVRLPIGQPLTVREIMKITGLSRSSLMWYLKGDWPNGGLVDVKKEGRRVYYTRKFDASGPYEIADMLRERGVRIIGSLERPLNEPKK